MIFHLFPVRETMKKNKLEEEEAEEEMDEVSNSSALFYLIFCSFAHNKYLAFSSSTQLHHENEELHQQLEKLQKENKEMKAKLSSMSDDSEKLGGLKVSLMKEHIFYPCHPL